MRKIFTIFSAILFLCASARLGAQAFHPNEDTVYITWPAGSSGILSYEDSLIVPSGRTTVQWRADTTNFPSDWQSGAGVCDNITCYSSALLWPGKAVKTSAHYCDTCDNNFDLQADLDAAASLGTYFYRVRIYNATDTVFETYIITRLHGTSVPQLPAPNASDVLLYPNPASSEINIVCDQSMDVRNIAVYNIIGKVMSVYKVAGNTANINIDNMPSGVYFVRLVNSQGNVVTTKRFTKQ